MKPISTLLILGLGLLPMACTNTPGEPMHDAASAPASTALVVPDLPMRTTELGAPQEYDQLRDAYDKSRLKLEKNTSDLDAWLRMSEVFITEARITGNYGPNYDKALAILDHVLESNTKDAAHRGEALSLKATVKLSQHQFKEALDLGKEAVELDPHRAFNYGVLVDANVELGNYAEAVRMSDKMVGTRPDLRSYSRVSYLREIHGDIPGAIEAMDMAVKAGYPGMEETEWCRVMLGRLHENRGDLKRAEEHCMLAISERKNYPPAMAAMGRIELKKKNHEKAEEWLAKAIALMPDPHYFMELARIHSSTGQVAARTEALAKAEELLIGLSGIAPEHAHAHGGEMHTHEQGPDEGHAHAHAAPDHGHSHEIGLEMGRFELEFHKDLEVALQNGLHEFSIRPDNIDVNALLAGVYYAKGDLANAELHLIKAQRTGSKDAMLQCLAGLIASKRGDADKARSLVSASFKADPYQVHPFVMEARQLMQG